MGTIRILDDHIANQIAAGEVVERPSSVVKELVENAVDAGSRTVDVTIEEGGLTLIKVADNGTGVAGDELKIAFQRHATSKISSGKDLFRILTLGFRGEALPSIAAVAKVECVSANKEDGLGRRLVIEGGRVLADEPAASPKGTTIAVRELFYNTPARLKYMKTIQTELGHVSDYMYRLAMAHPEIGFTLRHNGSLLLQTVGGGDLLQVVAAVYGTSVAKMMVEVEAEGPDYALTGLVSKPELTRSGRNAVSTFVNGRYVRNFALTQAVLESFHTLLPVHRFPVAALRLRMDPELLDVNVHPAKLEVRFSKEAELVAFVTEAVASGLRRHVLIPSAVKPQGGKSPFIQERMELYRPGAPRQRQDFPAAPTSSFGAASPRIPSLPEAFGVVRPGAGDAGGDLAGLAPAGGSAGTTPAGGFTGITPAGVGPAGSSPDGTSAPGGASRDSAAASYASAPASTNGFAAMPPSEALPGARPPGRPGAAGTPDASALRAWTQAAAQSMTAEAQAAPVFPQLEPIGQLHGTYIVAQNDTGLFLIDQHAAHERIHYEHYFDLFGKPPEASQQLLVPITLEFTPSEAELLKQRLPLFAQVGVELEPFGGNAFLVRAYPHWLPAGEERRIVGEMTDWVLAERKAVDIGKLREKSAILCSCKASIKANQSLQIVEMEALLDRLAACRIPYTCPHGRPIVISFSTYELEKMFKRVM